MLVYTAFIAHLQPEMCPLGAFSFYHHYIHDVKDITASVNINWSVNKSWRQVGFFKVMIFIAHLIDRFAYCMVRDLQQLPTMSRVSIISMLELFHQLNLFQE
jgi:hypothetical protein